ncbi:MAG: VOC family protein [Rhodobacteraceae bacterium]|nr:VOC family protein [Paracoccaceae bacterium]
MQVRRVVANLHAPEPLALAHFYQRVFGFDLPLDMDWISFLVTGGSQKVELHTASEGGSGTALPVISIEVDDLVEAHAAVRDAGAEVVYGPVSEPWGIRRFYFRDPAGNLVNIVTSI